MIGTLHAHCFRALGQPPIAESKIKEWNKENHELALSSTKESVDDLTEQRGAQTGDQDLAELNIYRSNLTLYDLWSDRAKRFYARWQAWKDHHGLMDFTDLIERCVEDTSVAPGKPLVMIGDEAQDWSRLEFKLFCDTWGKHAETLILAGDFDQCHPGDTLIQTKTGPKRIKDLNPDKDRLISFSRHEKKFFGVRPQSKGYGFQISSRHYSGRLINVICNGETVQCTPNHKWLIKWNKKAKDTNLRCVYLMQKNNDFRVGHCQLFNVEGTFHPKIRANLEGVDKFWILKVCDNSIDSYAYENIISCIYGIPQLPFRVNESHKNLTRKSIDEVFSKVDSKLKAGKCLSDHGLDIDLPFLHKDNGKYSQLLTINACNILSDLMLVPYFDGTKNANWSPVKIEITPETKTKVYSLNVEKWHTYIANNLSTCNCIYSWRAADPYYFINNPVPDDCKRVRKQSYRVPKAVHDKAHKWIRQIKKRDDVDYYPTKEQGRVFELDANYKYCERLIDDIHYQIDRGKTCMVIASCSYMLKNIIAQLKKDGIPFSNKYRRQNALWNPLGRKQKARMPVDRISSFLAPRLESQGISQQATLARWTKQQLKSWATTLKTDMFVRGVKTKLDEDYFQVPSNMGEWMQFFKNEDDVHKALFLDLDWYVDNLLPKYQSTVGYAAHAAYTYGDDAIQKPPPVTIGTIHSVKGGEADCVYLFPDISFQAMVGYTAGGEFRDSIIRTFYVGMTRAKEELILCKQLSNLAVGW